MPYSLRFSASLIAVALIVAMAFATLVSLPWHTHANPLGFGCPAYGPGGVASTTVRYLTPGRATTTLTYDTYCSTGSNQTDIGNPTLANKLTLLTQFSASSTNSTLNMTVEYSQDGVDWYQDNLTSLSTFGTTTPIVAANTFAWPFASSTINGVTQSTGNGTIALSTLIGKVMQLTTPTRYVRVVYTLSVGATATGGAVWAEVLPLKEHP